ncbi:hypothetical protein LG3211_2914 [Lysobacter gummosus]|nr:hypothetical protein LG3211_2914 [Lysobacter gummosus]
MDRLSCAALAPPGPGRDRRRGRPIRRCAGPLYPGNCRFPRPFAGAGWIFSTQALDPAKICPL